MAQPLAALTVMSSERASDLMACLSRVAASVLTASSCDEAAVLLRGDPSINVVLTDLCLPDGSWFDVLNRVADLRPQAAVIVCARLADERLWAEVLGAGGFDVLSPPYSEAEVRRVLTRAADRQAASSMVAAV